MPYLFPSPKIEPPYCYRCPFGQKYPSCRLACAEELDTVVRRIGPSNISAFIAEPVSGGPLGALVAPRDYFARIREICDRRGILMIVDEVVTGAGRTGRPLGIDHFGVTPDIITLGKGVGGGFVPIGAVLVHDRVYKRLEESWRSISPWRDIHRACRAGRSRRRCARSFETPTAHRAGERERGSSRHQANDADGAPERR